MALLAQGELERAEATFHIALTADGEAADPYYGLGRVYAQQGKRQDAIEALETYLRLAPNGSLSGEVRQLLDELNASSGGG
jgi:tetratricopeptide (TPR) repeat protein